jgi:hypothetical protein
MLAAILASPLPTAEKKDLGLVSQFLAAYTARCGSSPFYQSWHHEQPASALFALHLS